MYPLLTQLSNKFELEILRPHTPSGRLDQHDQAPKSGLAYCVGDTCLLLNLLINVEASPVLFELVFMEDFALDTRLTIAVAAKKKGP